MPLQPGHVYIGRGDADVILGSRSAGPVVMAAPSGPAYRWHPSVDRLVESALGLFEAGRLVGVLMTGMGNDGAQAMTRLRSQGGRTIAEARGDGDRLGHARRARAGRRGRGRVVPWTRSPATSSPWRHSDGRRSDDPGFV